MSLKFTHAGRTPQDNVEVSYDLQHSSGKYGTTLGLEVRLTISREGLNASMLIEGPCMSTPDDALDKLAEWLERSAEALRRRDEGAMALFIPLVWRTGL